MEKPDILQRTAVGSYTVGPADSRKLLRLYRAYLDGICDAEDESSRRLPLSAMVFALFGWIALLFFVFKE